MEEEPSNVEEFEDGVNNIEENVEYVDEDLDKPNNSSVGPAVLIGLVMLALLELGFWLYEKWKKWKSKKEEERSDKLGIYL